MTLLDLVEKVTPTEFVGDGMRSAWMYANEEFIYTIILWLSGKCSLRVLHMSAWVESREFKYPINNTKEFEISPAYVSLIYLKGVI